MSFQAFRGSAFNHSHENKAFNTLYDLLKQNWVEKDEPLYLFGNLFVGGKEFDAMVVKRNAFIVIDFKNFGGNVQFSENNRWTCAGVPVKGGNSINPFQQLRTNKFALIDFIKSDQFHLRSKPHLGHVAALALFQQPIEFDELKVPAKIRSWFHVGDMQHAVRTIDSIASPSIDLPDTDLESLITAFDVPVYFPDGYPKTKTISPVESKSGPTYSWTKGQQQVLEEASEWLNGDTTALIVTGMVNTGKKTVLPALIELIEQQGFTPLFLTPKAFIANRYQLLGFEDCYSIYTQLYNSKPDRLEKTKDNSDIGIGVHDVKLTPEKVVGKCLIIVEAHLVGNSYSATDTTRFGTGFLANDLLEALGEKPPKIALIGDPYQLTHGELKLSIIHSNIFEERGLNANRVDLAEQIRPDSKQHGLLDYQFKLAKQLKHRHFNRLPELCSEQVHEVKKDPALPNALSKTGFRAVYLCALNRVAHKINLAVRKTLRPQARYGLEVNDKVDFYNRTPVLQEVVNGKAGIEEQEISYVSAGHIGVVEWVSESEEVHYVSLKGRSEPTKLCFKMMQCNIPALGSVKVRYLPDYLTNETKDLSSDQSLAMRVFARQQAEREFPDQKTNLERLKKSKNATDKRRYKAEKKHFDMLIYQRIMSDGYFNAARIRFAYAMTVHRGQGREWGHVILNAEQSSGGVSHHNDEYFRFLYTATACSSDKLSLLKYPKLTPLSYCDFKANSQCKIGHFHIQRPLRYDLQKVADVRFKPPKGLTNGAPALIALLLTLTDRLNGSQWQIESIAQHNYQEHYTFISSLEQKVLARFSYRGDYSISNIVWDAYNLNQAELQELQEKIYGKYSFDTWEVKEAVTSLDKLLLPEGFTRSHVKESSYRAQTGFTHPEGAIELEINVNKKGLVSSIRPLRASDEKMISNVQKLVDLV